MSRSTAFACLIAVAATVLRAQFVFFPPGDHSDELIVASISDRATNGGRWSANWEGLPDDAWPMPTYQFSPYSLLESATAFAANRLFGFPSAFRDHLRFARWFSVLLGGLAVLVCFFATKSWFGSVRIAFVAECLLSVAFLHVQDCCYARVEAMLSLSVLLTFWAAGRTMNAPSMWNHITLGLAMGFTIAVKYNAAPIVVLALAALDLRAPMRVAAKLGSVIAISAVVGFFVATPEAVVHPRPLVEGIQYELEHYAKGHPPHQAMDASDGNAKFWWNYFTRLGFGWFPALAALGFVAASIRLTPRDRLLALFLVLSMIPLLVAKVRFERNAEVLLGPACLAAARIIDFCWQGRRRTITRPLLFVIAAGGLTANVVQHGLALVDFRFVQKRRNSPLWSIPESFRKSDYYGKFVGHPPAPNWETYDTLLLSGYSDAFSQRGLAEWRERLRDWDLAMYKSDWYAAGYPFSTVETYHGPGFVLRATRKK